MNLDDLKNSSKTPLPGKDRSQDGENRIVNYIFKELNIIPKYAVEFGSGIVSKKGGTANISWFHDEYKCECLFFEANHKKIKCSQKHYRSQIKIEVISASNVNKIFEKYEVSKNLDIVVIDVDGQDYWIWEKLEYKPKVLLIEFNPQLPPKEDKVMHYDEKHWKWRNTNCGYYGASIGALKKLYVDLDIPVEELYDLYKGKAEEKGRNKCVNKQKWVMI